MAVRAGPPRGWLWLPLWLAAWLASTTCLAHFNLFISQEEVRQLMGE